MKNTTMRFLVVILIMLVVPVFTLLGCAAEELPLTEPEEEITQPEEEITEMEEGVNLDSLGIDRAKYSSEVTNDPLGNPPVFVDALNLTDEEIAEIKEGNYTSVQLWAGSGEWYDGLTIGISSVFDELGIENILISDSEYDPAKQATDVETALALNPDIIFTLPIDPVSAAAAFQPAVDQGVTLVLVDNGIEGYVPGEDYASLVTGNHFGMGRAAAELMNEAIGGEGEIGFIYHDTEYFITNNRDGSFACAIEQNYPNIKIIDAGGIVEESKGGEVASAMLERYPEIDGIYVTWAVVAQSVISELRAAQRDDVKVVTMDLDAVTDLDMVLGGNVYGTASDVVYDIGVGLAMAAAYDLLDKEAPPFVIADFMKVTKDNVVEAWQKAFRIDPPASILDAVNSQNS